MDKLHTALSRQLAESHPPRLPGHAPGDMDQAVARENMRAAVTATTGDLFLDAINKATYVAFASGAGACQSREFSRE